MNKRADFTITPYETKTGLLSKHITYINVSYINANLLTISGCELTKDDFPLTVDFGKKTLQTRPGAEIKAVWTLQATPYNMQYVGVGYQIEVPIFK